MSSESFNYVNVESTGQNNYCYGVMPYVLLVMEECVVMC